MPEHALSDAALNPVTSRVLAARGIVERWQLDLGVAGLLPPDDMRDLVSASALIADAIEADQRIVIAGDYDADGATGVSVAVLGLRMLGAQRVGFVVPNRLTMGYGLSPQLVQEAHAKGCDLLITVDNGISSHAGAEAALRAGMRLIITDHHLPGEALPHCDALVNPNQPECKFGSRNLAGVGVMFYVLCGVRAALRERARFADDKQPKLADLLDLVALGTVADLVPLDRNNRILVEAGLARMRAGRGRPGLYALLDLAGRDASELSASDLGFALGPRINAAGRLDDIRVGIRCLLADDPTEAMSAARELDQINRVRRKMQRQMSESAIDMRVCGALDDQFGITLFDPQWHEGVVGLVATRVKDHHHRPTVVFARAQQAGMLKGSGRSVEGLHLRDVLARIDSEHPQMIDKFGGHAMAAGLSLAESEFAAFREAFDACCKAALTPAQLERCVDTDGPLEGQEISLQTAQSLASVGPWGQGMPEPLFDNVVEVTEARVIGSDHAHARYRLRFPGGPTISAVDFGGAQRLCRRGLVRVVYGLTVNRWQGQESAQLMIKLITPAQVSPSELAQ